METAVLKEKIERLNPKEIKDLTDEELLYIVDETINQQATEKSRFCKYWNNPNIYHQQFTNELLNRGYVKGYYKKTDITHQDESRIEQFYPNELKATVKKTVQGDIQIFERLEAMQNKYNWALKSAVFSTVLDKGLKDFGF